MPQRAWSKKRERQYQHIKAGLKDEGRSEDLAEEIAARTVNKRCSPTPAMAKISRPGVDHGQLDGRSVVGCARTRARRDELAGPCSSTARSQSP